MPPAQIAFTLRAVQRPSSIPVSLASLHLIQQTTASFSWTLYHFFDQFGSIADQLATVRKLYEVENIRNQIVDGCVPFPEDAQKVRAGIAVEFRWALKICMSFGRTDSSLCRNVSFKYPGSENWAVRDVSFKLSAGQLCVRTAFNVIYIFRL